MIFLKRIVILLGIVIIPNLLFCQKNQIGVQLGVAHFYFDNSGLFNKNIEGKSKLKFGEHFHESWGVNYSRNLNEKSRIGLEVEYLNTFYHNSDESYPIIANRFWTSISLLYTQNQYLKKKLSINYGLGINCRLGSELVDVALIPLGPPELGLYEFLTVGVARRDVGMNIFGSIQYDLNETFFVYSKLDFLGILYVHDKEGQRRMRDVYDVPQYPSRLDLSVNFGVGINF